MSIQQFRVWPGKPYPLGASWDGSGTNFAIFSAHAEKVELCLFSETGKREIARIVMPEYSHEIWHCYLPDVRAGQLYGYRVYGPYDPSKGHRFNHHKLLLDPYAKGYSGSLKWHDSHFGYIPGHARADLSFNKQDNSRYMPKCKVIDPSFTWREDYFSGTPWDRSIIYELHPRGFTMLHPDVPDGLRGTFAGLSHPSIISRIRKLGVTAVELLPVHTFIQDRHLVDRGLSNYWGYNSIGFFSLHADYLHTGLIDEFKTFVQLMHDADLEVILDVVFNHTAEGNHLGPTLSFRGIDNASYYYLMHDNPRYYNDFTGTGNALELRHSMVLRMVTDSLRYWVQEMKVDGFRFDLATTLAREGGIYDQDSGFLDAVAQDPVLSSCKLIAEPWDTGPDGYQLGNFPPGWAEWNDSFRDTVRRFWKGDSAQVPQLASRITGSSDIFDKRGRRPWASINFISAHDGFTLYDVVTYNRKLNDANLEGGKDGHDHNFSWNHGVDGPVDDEEILDARFRHMRNMMATLLLSQGVPMITAGDEIVRTQGGNNNPYCQDNEISWFPWGNIDSRAMSFLDFTSALIKLRKDHIVLRRSRFFLGQKIPGAAAEDICWLRPEGTEMQEEDWHQQEDRFLRCYINGEAGNRYLTIRGEPEPDCSFEFFMNASRDRIECRLRKLHDDRPEIVLDTSRDQQGNTSLRLHGNTTDIISIPPDTMIVIRYRPAIGTS
ncbi:glycogen debranching protein GlgX [Spirochaeta dissipatitropha]